MSRLYNNTPLANLPVNTVKWDGTWNHSEWMKNATKDKPGILCDGKVVNQARISIASSPDAPKARYYILFIDIERAHRRKFDASGTEIEPNFSETTKVLTGYLNSSYDVKAKGNTDRLKVDEVKRLVHSPQISAMIRDIVAKSNVGDFTLLMKEDDRDKIELPNGTSVRLKTAGDVPIIESLVVRDDLTATAGNFAGDEKVGGNWTDKIMALKSTTTVEKCQEPSEVADEEWDD